MRFKRISKEVKELTNSYRKAYIKNDTKLLISIKEQAEKKLSRTRREDNKDVLKSLIAAINGASIVILD